MKKSNQKAHQPSPSEPTPSYCAYRLWRGVEHKEADPVSRAARKKLAKLQARTGVGQLAPILTNLKRKALPN